MKRKRTIAWENPFFTLHEKDLTSRVIAISGGVYNMTTETMLGDKIAGTMNMSFTIYKDDINRTIAIGNHRLETNVPEDMRPYVLLEMACRIYAERNVLPSEVASIAHLVAEKHAQYYRHLRKTT